MLITQDEDNGRFYTGISNDNSIMAIEVSQEDKLIPQFRDSQDDQMVNLRPPNSN